METDEPPDDEKRYGVRVYVIGTHITPVNSQNNDSIFLHQDYPYATVEGYLSGIIPRKRVKRLCRATEEEQEGLRKACEFIEHQREEKGPKVTIHSDPFYYRDKRLNLKQLNS